MSRRFGEEVPKEAPDSEKGEEPWREEVPSSSSSGNKRDEKESLLAWLRSDECGSEATAETAFGRRKVVYADYTASARAVRSIEEYILREMQPLYGNTHSSVTVTAEQTTLFVHEARQELRSATGAGDEDAVIFVGSGATAAVDLLLHLLTDGGDDDEELVVLHSLMEHHSSLLPWQRRARRVERVAESESGRIDKKHLEKLLSEIRLEHPQARIVGSFTAASNITGVLAEFELINGILKSHDALSVWDFATAAPYVEMNIGTADALFFSGHKFVGGVGSPGVLVVKKRLIRAKQPRRTGGGAVFFVEPSGTAHYLRDVEYREEAGTPDAVGAVRLALALRLKQSISSDVIRAREEAVTRRIMARLAACPSVVLLGPETMKRRLPIFSFLVKDAPSGFFFHHNYISALLNDLFGVQSRAGCACAGPYAQHLLGITQEISSRLLAALREDAGLDRLHLRRVGEYSQHEMLRPGFTRISLPYFASDSQVDFVAKAIQFVAEHAADFLHLYQLNAESGEWHHVRTRVFHGRKWLGHVSFGRNGLEISNERQHKRDESTPPSDLFKVAEEARVAALVARANKAAALPDGRLAFSAAASEMRWYILPIEVYEREVLRAVSTSTSSITYIIQPREYARSEDDITEETDNAASSSPRIVSEPEEVDKNEGDAVIESTIAQNTVKDLTGSDSQSVAACPLLAMATCDSAPSESGTCTFADLSSSLEECGIENGTTVEYEDEVELSNSASLPSQQDWQRRVIVRRRELSRREEAALPWAVPPLELYKQCTDVIHGLDMIKNGDRVLVCLSGGKDSLSLLHVLHHYWRRNKDRRGTQFELGAMTVDPGSPSFNPRPLIEYCRSLNIDYFYEEQDIIGAARGIRGLRSLCAFCSRMKRGRLAAAARLHGWNVLAMAHHLDDLAESFFIAAFQNGSLATMKAQYSTGSDNLRVIRPLVLVRERALREFAATAQLPVVPENCPACFDQATERHRMKQLLAAQELIFPDLFNSLRSALRPLLLVDSASTAEMRQRAIANIARERKGKNSKEETEG